MANGMMSEKKKFAISEKENIFQEEESNLTVLMKPSVKWTAYEMVSTIFGTYAAIC
jgi:hypothetical protein